MKQIINFSSLFVLLFFYLLVMPFFYSVFAVDITGSDSPEANFEQGSTNNEVMHLEVSGVNEDTFLDGDGTLTTGAGTQASILQT